jgi:signal transduction histidine kinase
VDLCRVVEAALERLKVPPDVPIRKRVNLRGPLPLVVGGQEQLSEAFFNLLQNAVDAMAPKGGGLLTVGCRAQTVQGRLWVIVWVRDTGVGIPRARLKRVGRQPHTTKPNYVGFGLGTVVTRACVQRLGGQIHWESRKGKGTRVTVGLPACQAGEPAFREGQR